MTAVCLPLMASACDRRSPEPASTSPNVLLVLIDTLRADKLGCYGSDLGLSPNIDRFAAEGSLFERAFAHAPWTLPSVSSLLTATYPGRHGAGGAIGNLKGLASDVRTMAECYADQGYDTGAIVNVLFLSPKFGISRGFEDYDYQPPRDDQRVQRRATEVTDTALTWLRDQKQRSNRPFFYMVHYFDPHLTYDPPAHFREKFALPADQTPDPDMFGTEQDMIRLRQGKVDVSLLPLYRLEHLYNGEIAYTDEQVGRLLGGLKEMGLDDSTVVVLTADHGEEFLDHRGFEHGHTLYDELIHVPLIIRYPELVRPGRVRAEVGHVGVAPTLCGLSGVQAEATFQGSSLEPLMFGEKPKSRAILSQGNMWGPMLTSLRYGGYKLITGPGKTALYHVAVDARERHDISGEEDQRERRTALSEVMERRLSQAGKGQAVELSSAEAKQLQALGYVGGNGEGDELDESSGTTTQPTSRPASEVVGGAS
jgi:arylsulfatase A-like enzyme